MTSEETRVTWEINLIKEIGSPMSLLVGKMGMFGLRGNYHYLTAMGILMRAYVIVCLLVVLSYCKCDRIMYNFMGNAVKFRNEIVKQNKAV